jgi:hypothetical protein
VCWPDVVQRVRPAARQRDHVVEVCAASLDTLAAQIANAAVALVHVAVRDRIGLRREPPDSLLTAALLTTLFWIGSAPLRLPSALFRSAIGAYPSLPERLSVRLLIAVNHLTQPLWILYAPLFPRIAPLVGVGCVVLLTCLVLDLFVGFMPLLLTSTLALAAPIAKAIDILRVTAECRSWLNRSTVTAGLNWVGRLSQERLAHGRGSRSRGGSGTAHTVMIRSLQSLVPATPSMSPLSAALRRAISLSVWTRLYIASLSRKFATANHAGDHSPRPLARLRAELGSRRARRRHQHMCITALAPHRHALIVPRSSHALALSRLASTIRRTSSATEIPSRFASRLRKAICGSVNEIICFVIPEVYHRVSLATQTREGAYL